MSKETEAKTSISFSSSSSSSSSSSNMFYYDAVESGSLDRINKAVVMMAGSPDGINYLNRDKKLPGWDEGEFAYFGSGRGNSALHLACWTGLSSQIVERLLELGADVNLKSSDDGYSPLHCASFSGNVELVALLLDRGCDVNVREDVIGATPLKWACIHGHKDVVELLLDRGADIHGKDNEGWNALYSATDKGHKDVVELLLNRGADIHYQNTRGYNALMWASFKCHRELVHLLLNRGANIHDSDNHGHTAHTFASLEGYAEIPNDLERWPFTMWVASLLELGLYHHLDCSSIIDFWQYIRQEI